jgi:hypothetical protein
MDDAADKEHPPADFNKIDLSQLQGFSFGTQWTQDKSSPASGRDGGDRPRRDERRDAYPGGPPNRKDRRSFQKPNGDLPPSGDRHPAAGRYEGGDDRGQRRPAGGPGDDRRRGAPREVGPYLSPYFSVIFYPEDASFTALAKTIRASCRTIELFEIARTVLGKPERFTVLVARKSPGTEGGEAPRAEAEPAAKAAPFYLSVPDSVPFESEQAAVAHALNQHLNLFFTRAEVEVEPPKGNFQVVNRCTITGELLGPPNYHRYAEIVQQHHAEKVSRMPLEAYRTRIESVRDPEVIKQWLEKMKKVTRYTWKDASAAVASVPAAAAAGEAAPSAPPSADVAEEAPAPAAPSAAASGEAAAPETLVPPVDNPVPAAPPAEAAAASAPALSFDTLDEARNHLLTHARDKIVRPTGTARFHGRALESLPAGEIRRAVEGEWERQCRFPLDTANALRGRLRREHFTIFKKGSKGVSYVCAVKRKFRVPGQVFAESIGTLITFIEHHPMVKASGLVEKFLGLVQPAPAAAGETAPEPAFTAEQRDKIGRLQGDVRWLVHEGYVTEFIDGTLYAPPPVVEARKREIEAEEQDPENFPERPNPSATAEDSPRRSPVGGEDGPPPAQAHPAENPAPSPPVASTPEPGSTEEPPAAV